MSESKNIDAISQGLADVNSFIQEKYDPLNQSVGLLREETDRLVDQVKGVLEGQREITRTALLRTQDVQPHALYKTPSGDSIWVDTIDLRIIHSFYQSGLRLRDSGHLSREQISGLPRWGENIDTVKRALDSTTSGSGDELVPTAELPELWADVNLATSIKSLFRNIQMPTNPFDVPLELGDVNWYRGTANVAATSTDLSTSKRTLSATEFVAVVAWAYDLDEDAVIAMLPEVRATLVKNTAEVQDSVILNGDTTDDGTSLNNDGGSSGDVSGTAGLDHYLAFDGLRHIPLIDNTGQGNNHSAVVSIDMFNEIRTKMDKYGVRPSELVWIMDLNTYIRSLSITNFQTLDKFGPQATILTGQLGAVEGIPVIVSEQMALADTDGKVTKGGNSADTGTVLCVNRSQYWIGSRRELLVEVERDVQKRQTVMVVSFRMAFDGRNTNSSDAAIAMQYNITGVS
jgi:HK97 family phage major capsid protein